MKILDIADKLEQGHKILKDGKSILYLVCDVVYKIKHISCKKLL